MREFAWKKLGKNRTLVALKVNTDKIKVKWSEAPFRIMVHHCTKSGSFLMFGDDFFSHSWKSKVLFQTIILRIFGGRPWKILQGVFGEVSVTSFLVDPHLYLVINMGFWTRNLFKNKAWKSHFTSCPPNVVAISVHDILALFLKIRQKTWTRSLDSNRGSRSIVVFVVCLSSLQLHCSCSSSWNDDKPITASRQKIRSRRMAFLWRQWPRCLTQEKMQVLPH